MALVHVCMTSLLMISFISWQVDLGNTIKKALVMGLDGVVLWGDHNLSNNKTICSKVKQYVDVVLGPFVQRLSKHSR